MMNRLLLTAGILLVAITLYFLGNFAIGKKREGGFRVIAFVTGLLCCGLGAIGLKEQLSGTASTHALLILCSVFILLGILLILMSLLASNSTVKKIVDGLSCGL